MIPEVGATCRFTFTAKFSTLDGVYRTRAETTFKDALVAGIDFVSNLYIPAGLSQDDFTTDSNGYMTDRIVVLESVIDSSVVYYVPESVFLLVPDPTIKEYFPLILVVDLGVQQNTQAVLPLLDNVKDMIQSTLGTKEPLRVITNPENKVYLTSSEYEDLVAARQESIQELLPLSVQLKRALDDKAFLAAQVAAYEAVIAQLSTVANPSGS